MKIKTTRKFIRFSLMTFFYLFAISLFQNCGKQFTTADLSKMNLNRSLASVEPQISVVNPVAPLSNSRSLSLKLNVTTNAQSSVRSVSCQLDLLPSFDCTSLNVNLTNIVDGDHALKVTATDTQGNISPQKVFTFRVDGTAPVPAISQAPASVSGSTTAIITFSAADALSGVKNISCSLDNAAFAVCSSPLALSSLSIGSHIFKIKSVDNAGNTSAEVSASWTVDASAPILTINTKPSMYSMSKTATFTFSGTSNGVALPSYECALDGGSYSTCVSPKTYSSLSEGSHNFSIRGITTASVVSSPLSASWTVDTIAPTTPVLTSNVTSPTQLTSASISINSTDTGSMISLYQCSFDGAAFTTCTSPKSLSSLSLSSHTLQARAVDNAGNVSATGSVTWIVEAAPVAIDGVTLYRNNCAGCHGELSVSAKLGRTAAQIQGAIATVGRMAGLSYLTAPEINAIAKALSVTSGDLANPFACNADTGVSVLRRLTKREYTNTVMDLFAGNVGDYDIKDQLINIPVEFTNSVPSVRVFDSTNPVAMNLSVLDAYNTVAAKAADAATSTTARMTNVGGSCMTVVPVSDTCVSTFLDNFGLKAYRRPFPAADKPMYMTLYRTGASPADSMARVIQALLLSPQFLYKLEVNGTGVGGRADLLQLDPYEIASRVSYSILGSMPDQPLFDAAKSGALSTSAGLQTQVDRLFTLTKAKQGIRGFYSQWFRLDYIPDIITNATFANGIDGNFRRDAKDEVISLMDHLLWTQKANYRTIMTTDLAIPRTPNMGKVYGVAPTGNYTPVVLSDPNRRGILTRAGMLALSPVGGSSPIKRGVNVRVHLLCDPLGSPPADVETLASPFDPLSSTRDQVTAKTSATQCMTCHSRINPAGFAFENFDGFGRFRTQETVTFGTMSATHNVDSTVAPNIASLADPVINGAAALQEVMSENSVGQACMAKQFLQYSTGRDVEANDGCALSSMYDAANNSGGSVLEMFKAYTRTPGFILKKLGPIN
ncbi:MAG: DUF1588 domain-containing protein [Bdellovibrionota bacterium]